MAETPTSESSTAAFAERLFGAILGAQEVQAVYLGDRLGWYRALADGGPLTAGELADRTGTAERYAREWLEHQAVCGYVTVEGGDADAPPEARRFLLPAPHARSWPTRTASRSSRRSLASSPGPACTWTPSLPPAGPGAG